jgi:penicillin-binding protein 1A
MGWFGGSDRKRERREPRLDDDEAHDDELRVDPSDSARHARPRKGAKAKSNARASSRPRQRRRGFFGWTFYWGSVAAVWGVIGVGGVVLYHFTQLPPIDQLAVPKRPPNIAILAADGSLLANRGDTGGAAVRIGELPAHLPNAFIAIEDHRFRSHWGVDPVGLGRALFNNLARRGGMQGGSTLTQQLAKNLFLTQERTFSRKVQEAILAIWLERNYSKDQILELYLNRVYFGSGAYGIEAAARKYYDKSARALTLAESATLAGLMVAPSKLAPNRNPEGAKERAEQVIAAMRREGFVTDAMASLARTKPADVARQTGAGSANYAADYVMDMLDETVGAIEEDIVVTTTIQPRLQAAAEKALVDELDAKGAKFGVAQGAVVAMDPNGAIRVLVGGRDYSQSQFNRATTAKRQPGSAFKPFVYLAALEKGLSPDATRVDGPINIKGWRPENYSREYFGEVTLTQALSLSLNTVAVKLGQEVGPKTVARLAHRLGIQSELNPTPSLALGSSEVTALELVTAYAPFANGGIGVQPHVIAKVRTAAGKPLYQRKGSKVGKVVEPDQVGMMNAMMQETLLTGTARKAELPGWQAAGKTGTSQEFRDAWFVGYTSQLVAGVWLGNDDSSPTKKVSGGNLPVEVWSRFMRQAHLGLPPTPLPGAGWRAPTPSGGIGDLLARGGEAPMRDPAGGGLMGGPAGGPLPSAQLPPPSLPSSTLSGPPRPPAAIPVSADAPRPPQRPRLSRDDQRDASRPPAERGFLEKMFGGG